MSAGQGRKAVSPGQDGVEPGSEVSTPGASRTSRSFLMCRGHYVHFRRRACAGRDHQSERHRPGALWT